MVDCDKVNGVVVLDLTNDFKTTGLLLPQKYDSSAIRYLSVTYIRSLNPLSLVKEMLRTTCTDFIIAVDDYEMQLDRFMFICLGSFVRSKRFFFLDKKNDSYCRISRPSFFLKHLPAGLLSLLASTLLAGVFAGVVFLLNQLIDLRRPDRRTGSLAGARPCRFAYLKSDLAFGMKAGGAVAHIRGVLSGLRNCGTQVLLVSNERPDWLSFDDTALHCFKPKRMFCFFRETERMFAGLALAFSSFKLVKKFDPDYIYLRQSPFDLSGILLSILLKKPLVLECNGSDVKGMYWSRIRFKNICAITERLMMKVAGTVVVVSDVLKEILIELGYPSEKILVSYNGVSPEEFDTPEQNCAAGPVRQQLGIGISDIVAGFVGTFGQWHGIPTLVKSVPEVLKQNPKIHFLLIGDGHLKSFAQDELSRDSNAARIHFTGLIPFDSVGAYIAACDILVSPHSRSPGGLKFIGSPTKLFEYMAARRPIVASRLDQIGDILEDRVSALMIEPDDEKALSKAVLELASDQELRLRLAEAARREVSEKYSWTHNVKRLLERLQVARL